MTSKSYVYESPDNGKTIYRRRAGSLERVCIKKDPFNPVEVANHWMKILEAARESPALYDAIRKVEMIYALVKKEDH